MAPGLVTPRRGILGKGRRGCNGLGFALGVEGFGFKVSVVWDVRVYFE